MSMENDGGMILAGENRRNRRQICPSATLSTTNPSCINPGANSELRGERPATNRLSDGTARPIQYAMAHMYCLKLSSVFGLWFWLWSHSSQFVFLFVCSKYPLFSFPFVYFEVLQLYPVLYSKVWCSLWGTNRILKYCLHELLLQREPFIAEPTN
jgi:hypothetical protein